MGWYKYEQSIHTGNYNSSPSTMLDAGKSTTVLNDGKFGLLYGNEKLIQQ